MFYAYTVGSGDVTAHVVYLSTKLLLLNHRAAPGVVYPYRKFCASLVIKRTIVGNLFVLPIIKSMRILLQINRCTCNVKDDKTANAIR